MAQAEEFHQGAKQEMKDQFENLTTAIILQHAKVFEEENTQSQNYSKSDNMAQATDPLILNADPASSNINNYKPRTNERLFAETLDLPIAIQNISQKSSNRMKKRKKKEKRRSQQISRQCNSRSNLWIC
ncbi:MAG: hypothetical protein EZS28_002659 [Streblomastix strix]|uniref:Uncharacterized protein n=1 Tax=Streblomastix strix TaxID=222440 RepID=A0A5J4X3M2_9EUKA|nr:MAG: hypothetical protein EZS28_002659 [Streblomastix strix]